MLVYSITESFLLIIDFSPDEIREISRFSCWHDETARLFRAGLRCWDWSRETHASVPASHCYHTNVFVPANTSLLMPIPLGLLILCTPCLLLSPWDILIWVWHLKSFLPIIIFGSPLCWTCAPQIIQHNPQTSFFPFLLFLEPLKVGMNTSWLSSIILHEKIFRLHLVPVKCEVLVLPNKGGRWSPKPSSLAEVPNVLADIKFVKFQTTNVQQCDVIPINLLKPLQLNSQLWHLFSLWKATIFFQI